MIVTLRQGSWVPSESITLSSKGPSYQIPKVALTEFQFVGAPCVRKLKGIPIIPIISLHALLYLFCFAVYLLEISKVRLIEHAVCQRYYRSHPLAEVGAEDNVPERQCKLVPIQAEVALITGWRISLDAIPSILTVTFYGALADQIGRKPALLLVCLGELLALIWSVLVCMSSYLSPTSRVRLVEVPLGEPIC